MRRAILSLALLGCSAGAPPPAEPPAVLLSPEPPPAPAPTVAETAAPVSPAPPPSATAVATAAPGPPQPPAVDRCRGADLDLDAILAVPDCDVRREAAAAPSPQAMAIEVTPARSTILGDETVDLTVAFVNRTGKELALDLPMSCGKAHQFEVEALDGAGKRADRINTTCGFGSGCGLRTLHLSLPAGGRLRAGLSFTAKVEKMDAQCQWQPGGPLRPGKYTLRVSTPLFDRDKVHVGEVHPRTGKAPLTVGR